ncbi:hypothetical protein [Bradyrhizobium tropiciagri]|uniref:hypothetical protein n=1 Tax=Bradyrhizobium tropiciagri TaxID=312253 RepID=UPI001BA60DBE|nr:hypothetical protein [Bradyrhizobium tropiciagri]MBR0894585.1 hypothetical protein [Bradyrhizobium tropiciagri]
MSAIIPASRPLHSRRHVEASVIFNGETVHSRFGAGEDLDNFSYLRPFQRMFAGRTGQLL